MAGRPSPRIEAIEKDISVVKQSIEAIDVDSIKAEVGAIKEDVASIRTSVTDGLKALEGQIAQILASGTKPPGGNGQKVEPHVPVQPRRTMKTMTPDEYHLGNNRNTDPVLQGPVPMDARGNSLSDDWVKDLENNRWIRVELSGDDRNQLLGEDGKPWFYPIDGELCPVIQWCTLYGPKAYVR